eukprot:1189468-Prorocentrum_minimum.AAC.7
MGGSLVRSTLYPALGFLLLCCECRAGGIHAGEVRQQDYEEINPQRNTSSSVFQHLSESDLESLLQLKVKEIVSSGNPDERSLLLNVIEQMRAVVLERTHPVWEFVQAR